MLIKKYLENSKKILVTSHKNCDQDGICSALATKLIIEKNFSNKKVLVNIESKLQENVSFLKSFKDIKTEDLFKKVEEFKPDLIIFTDSTSLSRFSSKPSDLKNLISKERISTVLIDHHRSKKDFEVNYHYNNMRTSCAEETYHLFKEKLALEIDSDIAEVILTGMIFDTGVFVYKNNFFRETANVVITLVEMGANIEKILDFKNTYTLDDLNVFTELNKNIVVKKGFCYSHISDDFFKKANLPEDKYKKAYQGWVDLFLKNMQGAKWGFVIRPNPNGLYSVTLRSKEGGRNVRLLAEKFGGGGHDYASGFDIKTETAKSVVEKIIKNLL